MSRTVLFVLAVVAIAVGPALAQGDNLAGVWPMADYNLSRTGDNPSVPYKFGAWVTGGAAVSWMHKTDTEYGVGRCAYGQQIAVDENDNIYWRSAYDPFKVASVDKNGALRWIQDLPAGISQWGDGWTSGVIVGRDAIYAVAKDYNAATGGDTGYLMAINKATGATMWYTLLKPNGTYVGTRPTGAHAVPALYNGVLYTIGAVPTDNYSKDSVITIYAVEAATGTILKQADLPYRPNGNVGMAPTLVPDIFGVGKHGLFFNVDGGAVPTGSPREPGLYAVEVDTAAGYTFTMKWTAMSGKTGYSRPIYSAVTNRIYLKTWSDYGQSFAAYDAITGAQIFQLNAGTGHGYEDVGWLERDGSGVIAGGFAGQFIRYRDNGTTGEWSMWYDGPDTWGEEFGPSITIGSGPKNPNGVLIVPKRGNAGLVAIDGGGRCIRSLWSYDFPGTTATGMRGGVVPLSDGRVVAFTDQSQLYCIESTNIPEMTCGTVSGRVTLAGDPAPGAIVGIKVGAAAKNAVSDATLYYVCDADGRFGPVQYLQDTVLKIGAWTVGGKASEDYTVVVQPSVDTPVTIDLPISGVWKEAGMTAVCDTTNLNGTGVPPEGAVDGALDGFVQNLDTPINATNPFWLMVDLGANTPIDEAEVHTRHECAFDYKIQALPDGFDPTIEANWTNSAITAYDVAGGNGGYQWPNQSRVEPIRFLDASGAPRTINARYWRLYVTRAWDTLWIWEFVLQSATESLANPTNNRIGTAKQLLDGEPVSLISKIVTASGGAVPADAFYIEDANRAAGIRVIGDPGGAGVGHAVSVVGTMTTTLDGERAILASTITDGGLKGRIRPLGMSNRSTALDLACGLLVKLAGTVKSQTPDGFMLDDGSDPAGVGIRVITGGGGPADGEFTVLEGIVGRADGGLAIFATKLELTEGDVLADGYLRSWLLNGWYQVPNPGGTDIDWQIATLGTDFLDPPGEANVQPSPGSVDGGKTWFAWTQLGLSPVYDLLQPFPNSPGQSTVYAHVYIWSPVEYDIFNPAEVRIGSDDGYKLYLNGEVIGDNPTAARGCTPDEDVFVVTNLHVGWNRLTMKIHNIYGGYGLAVRFTQGTDGSGNPVPLPGLKYSLYPAPQ